MMGQEHILLTSLGMRSQETTYQWGEDEAAAPLTPLALVKLLDPSQRPNRVVAVVTKEAKAATWETFRTGIHAVLGFEPEKILIPNGSNSDEIGQILEKVAQRIPENAKLTLDVTQGLRHFPFIFYALVLYLKSLRGVQVRGAYYGMIEGTPPNAPKPIIDLQPLLELPEWFHAVRMFRDQGTTLPIAQLIQPLACSLDGEAGELFTDGNRHEGIQRRKQASEVKHVINWLKKFSFAYESALPLELGKASQELIEPIGKLACMGIAGLPPLAASLTDSIASVAKKTAFAGAVKGGGVWKTGVWLNEEELARQAQMIDLYLYRDQLSLAVGLMREWVVSWAIWKSGETAETQEWLNHTVRQRYEHRLGALGAFVRNPSSTPAQKEFGMFWDQLVELRNILHHHDMKEQNIPNTRKKVRSFWDQLKANEIDLPTLGGGGGTLLLSPQGTKPGVLFSALKVAGPDSCLVICSADSATSIDQACQQAGFQGEVKPIELADPHGGFDEIKAAAEQAHDTLLNADKVVANVTGGTTLMGLVVQRLAEEAKKLDRPVRRFALIDRRLPTEQDSDPFVQGDCHWIDN